MDSSVLKKHKLRKKRAQRIRKKLRGTSQKPRLSVFKSNENLYVQLIDDSSSQTLTQACSLEKELKSEKRCRNTKDDAQLIGKKIAQRALDKGITEVVFDRGSSPYHGVISVLADAARENGLKF